MVTALCFDRSSYQNERPRDPYSMWTLGTLWTASVFRGANVHWYISFVPLRTGSEPPYTMHLVDGKSPVDPDIPSPPEGTKVISLRSYVLPDIPVNIVLAVPQDWVEPNPW